MCVATCPHTTFSSGAQIANTTRPAGAEPLLNWLLYFQVQQRVTFKMTKNASAA